MCIGGAQLRIGGAPWAEYSQMAKGQSKAHGNNIEIAARYMEGLREDLL